MSRTRYAPITSHLLVRKGEARPWNVGGSGFLEFTPPSPEFAEPAENVLEREDEERIQAEYEKWMREREIPPVRQNHHAHHGEDNVRRCTIRLTPSEFERLGIVAVKREITRQEALRQAVERYLSAAKRQFRSRCNCLGGQCKGSC